MKNAAGIFLLVHLMVAGASFAILKWWEGIIAFVPVIGDAYAGIRMVSTRPFWGIVSLCNVALFIIITIAYAVQAARLKR
jgi:hypothetical protein